jgi:stage II sporulation protein AA (anti-sigma F factor antagonist)
MVPTSFGIESQTTDGVRILSVRGELDLATAPQLGELLEVRDGDPDPVLVNLSDCEFIDSTGIAVVVRAWQQRQGDDGLPPSGLLALCAPDKQVRRLLDVTGVGTTISVFDDCDAALEDLRARAASSG